MPVPYELATRLRVSPVFVLELDGLEDRFVSDGIDPPANPNFDGWRSGVVQVGATVSEIDQVGGVADEEPVEVVIANTPANGAATLLMRITELGSPLRARLATDLDMQAAGPVPIEVDRDISAWPVPGVLYVGQEAIHYTAISSPPGGPYRFQGVITRGYYQSKVEPHRYASSDGPEAWVTGHATAWDARRARVWMSNRRHDGSAEANWLMHVNGRLQGPPEIDASGTRITIQILPLTHVLRGVLGDDAQDAYLAQGWHLFEQSAGTRIRHRQFWDAGEAIDEALVQIEALGAATLHCGQSAAGELHDQLFDITLAADALGYPHPRIGRLHVPNQGIGGTAIRTVTAYNAGPPPWFTIGAVLTAAINRAARIENYQTAEIFSYDVLIDSPDFAPAAERALRWPDQVLQNWTNASWTLVVGTSGAAGRWAKLAIYPSGEDGYELVARLAHPEGDVPAGVLRVNPLNLTLGHLFYGLDLTDPETLDFWLPIDDDVSGRPDNYRMRSRWHRDFEIGATVKMTPTADRFPIRGCPSAYYQTGERYILADANPFPTPPFLLRIYSTHDRSAEVKPWILYAQITAATEVFDPAIPANSIGWKLEVAETGGGRRSTIWPFGDWPGRPRVRLRAVAGFRGELPTTVLLRLLLSGEGNGFNHATYDSLPIGLNLHQDHVDVESFERFAIPPFAGLIYLDLATELKIDELIDGLLTSLGAVITTRLNLDTGRRELTLGRAGVATTFESLVALDDDDARDGRFVASVDDRVVNGLKLACNWDRDAEEFGVEVIFVNDPGVRNLGRLEQIEVELKGIVIQEGDATGAKARFLPLFGELVNLFGRKAREIDLPLALRTAALLTAGDVVTLSSSKLIDVDGSTGISSSALRILSSEIDPQRGTSRLRARLYSGNPTGWAPSMRVLGLVDATHVDVELHEFTDLLDPVTGAAKTDFDWWIENGDAAGWPVNCLEVPDGDAGAAVANTITGITAAGRVAFGAAHALLVGDYIDPPPHASATAWLRRFGYLAASTGLLSGGEDAYTYG